MSDDLRAHSPVLQSNPSQGQWDWESILLKTGFALLVAVAMWWIVWSSLESRSIRPQWRQDVFLPVAILVVACLVALRHERHWAWPVRRFLALMEKIRSGDAPIEQLSEIGGGLVDVMPIVQDLLHEIRRQKLAVAMLNEETRQRIASRTGALERMIGSLRQQAARDALTGLYNRRMLEQLLPRLLDRCRAEGVDLCVLMIDIDYFKQLNDTLGHAAGDELLHDVACVIQSSLSDRDLAIRYGGDEFVVLMPGADSGAVDALSQRLSSLVEVLSKPLRVQMPPRLSIGRAQLSRLGAASAQELLMAADRDLYDVKGSKRRGEQV